MANVDLKRDLCVDEAYDSLEVGDVDGILNVSPHSLANAADARGAAFLVEIGKLMSAHNRGCVRISG